MHFEFTRHDKTGRTVLQAHPDDTDQVPPLPVLLLDRPPRHASKDHLAIASVILFGGFIDRTIKLPARIRRETLDAIEQFTGAVVRSDISHEEPDDTAIRATDLEVRLEMSIDGDTPAIDHTRLTLVPGDRFNGALLGIKESIVASNAWLLADSSGIARAAAGAGVLFAEEFLVSHLSIPVPAGQASTDLAEIQRLCAPLGLTVS